MTRLAKELLAYIVSAIGNRLLISGTRSVVRGKRRLERAQGLHALADRIAPPPADHLAWRRNEVAEMLERVSRP